jgi:adenylate cyclase
LAEPGGICISRVVRDQIRDKLPYPFEDRGEQSVKNIARSVRVFALRPEAVAELPAASVPAPASQHRIAPAAMATVAAAALVIAVIAWWFWPATRSSPTPPAAVGTASESAQIAPSVTEPAVAPRLSIVVLPFANLTNDPEQQYLADGITEDLTTDLSRIGHMFVISRNTAFTYRAKSVNAKQIGRELGVRYVLEGSVQRSGNQVRISAQLIDAATDRHLWAERFDRDRSDLFAMQNEITGRIANTLNGELVTVEASRATDQPDVLDYILRGRAAWNKGPMRDNLAQAIGLFERALALNPQSVEAQSSLADALATRVLARQTDTPAADIARAEELVGQALVASPGSTRAHYVKGQVLRAQGRCQEAIPQFETVIASAPNFRSAYGNLGWCKFWTGSIEEVIPLEEQAIRLSPRDPFIGTLYFRIGTVHLLQSHTDEAIVWLEKARGANPAQVDLNAYLASAYALKGQTKRAAFELAEARRLNDDDRYSSIARLKARPWGAPTIRALFETTYFAGLRKAGMPEE